MSSTVSVRFKKKAIPGASKIALAYRVGAIPGRSSQIDCAYCSVTGTLWWPLTYTGKVGAHMVATGFEIDHIHPESKGGSSDVDNLTFACRPCNRAKKDKVL